MPHTPGPWGRNIKPASRYPTIFAGRNTHVATIVARGLPEAEIEANCDLIAAAPNLYLALKALVDACETLQLQSLELQSFQVSESGASRAAPRSKASSLD